MRNREDSSEYHEGREDSQIDIRTDLKELERIDEDFAKRLEEAGVPEDEMFMLQLGLREAAVNGLVHGNLGIEAGSGKWDEQVKQKLKENPELAEKLLRIKYLNMNKDNVEVSVEDEGEGFDYEGLSEDFENGLAEDSGRGFKLMNQVYDVEYEGEGNKVTLRWPKEKKETES